MWGRVRGSRRGVGLALVAGTLAAGTVTAWSAQAITVLPSPVVFVGTDPGDSTLGGYTLTAFPTDPLPVDYSSTETSIPAPGGASLGVSYPVSKLPDGLLAGAPSGGSAYFDLAGAYDSSVAHPTVTLTLPPGVSAFSFYAVNDECGSFTVTATTDDGTTSGEQPTSVCGGIDGAHYFGFYTTDRSPIKTITLTTTAPLYDVLFGDMAESAGPPPIPVSLSAPNLAQTFRLHSGRGYDLVESVLTSPSPGHRATAVANGQQVAFSTVSGSNDPQSLGTASTSRGRAVLQVTDQQLTQLRSADQIQVAFTPATGQNYAATTKLFPLH